jgi:hypothetical protein
MVADRFERGVRLGPSYTNKPLRGAERFRYGETLAVRDSTEGPIISCTDCEHVLGPAADDPRARALMLEEPLSAFSPLNGYQPADVVVRVYCCPGCATTFSCDVQLRSEDPRSPEMHLHVEQAAASLEEPILSHA